MMCFPCALSLVTTADGPRLAWQPVKEIETLRDKSHKLGLVSLKPGAIDPLARLKGELLEVRLEAEPGRDSELELSVRGTAVRYDAKKQELSVGGHKAPA